MNTTKKLYPLRGIITVLNTPFTVSGSVDYPSLEANISAALKAGVAGFLVPAMASEVNKLTLKERLAMVETTLKAAGDKVPVFAGLGEKQFNRSRDLLKAYLDAGCSSILFQIPYENEDQFTSWFLKLAELQAEVIMLQDWDASGYGLPDALITGLFEQVEAFRCLKIETVPAGVKYSRMLELTEGRLHVSGGWAVSQMIEGLRRGVHAFMPTGMHYIYTQIYKDYVSGKRAEAQQLFEKILPVLSFSNQHLEISIHFFKRLLYHQGIYQTDLVRPPAIEFDKIHKEISDDLIRRINQLEEEIRDQRAGKDES